MAASTTSIPRIAVPSPREDAHGERGERWLDRARDIRHRLREGAAERDRRGGVPHEEVGWLREAGLLGIFVPAEHGGGGATWSETAAVVQEVAKADSSIAHVLLYHYFGSLAGATGTENGPLGPARARRIAQDGVFHGTVAQAAYEPLVEARPDGDGFVLHGSKPFTSGAALGDVLLAWVRFAPGARLNGRDVAGHIATVHVEGGADGVRYEHDWDNVGQRLTVSGTTTLDGVRVPAGDVIHHGYGVEPTSAHANLDVIYMYSGFASIYTGIALGALEEGADYIRERGRPWVESTYERAAADPLVRERFGQLWVRAQAAAALNDRSTAVVDAARARGAELTWEERAETVIAVNASRVNAADAALEIGSRIFELTGARSTAVAHGLDRFWRNVRTLSLHDPLHHKQVQIGAWALEGEAPQPGFYS